jgi:ATP-dependent Clp protease protease subunit
VHFTNLKPTLNTTAQPRSDEDEESNPGSSSLGKVGAMIQKKFLAQRRVFIWGEVNTESARDLVEKFLYLESEDPGKPITFYIDTPGGSITDGMAIYDTIKMLSSPVTAVVTGMAASMGSILLCAADKGSRFVFPHSRVLIHQPLISGRMIAPAVDINIQALEMERLRTELNRILSEASGQSMEKIIQDTDRDFYMTAQEAIDYGLADKIVDKL